MANKVALVVLVGITGVWAYGEAGRPRMDQAALKEAPRRLALAQKPTEEEASEKALQHAENRQQAYKRLIAQAKRIADPAQRLFQVGRTEFIWKSPLRARNS